MRSMQTIFLAGFLAWAQLLASGCTVTYQFYSTTPLADGIVNKSWGSAYTADSALYDLIGLPGANSRLVNDFAAARYGSTFQLAATFYDTTSGTFKGYGRKYVDGTGWSSMGADFAVIATAAGAENLGLTTIAVSSGGTYLAVFANATFSSMVYTPRAFVTAANTGTWQAAQTSTPTTMTGYETFWGAYNTSFDSRFSISAAFDGLGRAFVGYTDINAEVIPRVARWQSGGGMSTAGTDLVEVSVPQLQGWWQNKAVYDGLSHLCFFFDALETSPTRNVSMNCIDLSGGTAPAATRTPLSTSTNTIALDAAADGDGTIVVAYVDRAAQNRIYANVITGGAAAARSQIDSGMPTGWQAHLTLTATAASLGAASDQISRLGPSVTYLGGGRFMAAWIGYCATCSPFVRQSRIFFSIYDVSTGLWSDAEEISGSSVTYTTTPRHAGLTLFSNEDGHAGIAASVIYVQSGSFNTDSETDQARKVQVGRWQEDVGWVMHSSLIGTGCKPAVGGTITNLSSCSHPPVGILFPSGNAVVLFQDQDSSGRYHLSAVEFQ